MDERAPMNRKVSRSTAKFVSGKAIRFQRQSKVRLDRQCGGICRYINNLPSAALYRFGDRRSACEGRRTLSIPFARCSPYNRWPYGSSDWQCKSFKQRASYSLPMISRVVKFKIPGLHVATATTDQDGLRSMLSGKAIRWMVKLVEVLHILES